MSDWQYLNVNGVPQSGSPAVGAGGGTLSGYRSMLDARRSAQGPGRTPQAEYPDGYLGNVPNRREDRLLKHVQSRLTNRSYQRGVHKGERVDPKDYYWDPVVHPQAGLEAQAAGLKWSQSGSTPEQRISSARSTEELVSPGDLSKTAAQVGLKAPAEINPVRSARMARLLPRWK